VINSDGYRDDEFDISIIEDTDFRILALGDSFTFGASATLGNSYIEQLETAFADDAVIWNVGIAGTATRQALALAEKYVPILQPDVVTLGFYFNDFNENLYPLDLYARTSDSWVLQYEINSDLSIKSVNDYTLYYRTHNVRPPQNTIESIVGQTRLGTVVINVIYNLRNPIDSDAMWQLEQDTTEELLADLKTYLDAEGIPLLVLHIPDMLDINSDNQRTRTYNTYNRIAEDLSLPTIDIIADLKLADYSTAGDGHWINSGHGIAADAMFECLQHIQATDQICPQALHISE